MKKKSDPRHLKRRGAVKALFSFSFRPETKNSLARLVIENLPAIDQIIRRSAPQWPTEKIGKTDLAILRLAIYELAIAKIQPPKVIIDEAVELAKEFAGETSPAFINGALGSALKERERMNLEKEIIMIISAHFGIPLEEITPQSNLIRDLNASQLEITDLILALEEKFQVKIPEEEFEKLEKVDDIINYVNEHLDEPSTL